MIKYDSIMFYTNESDRYVTVVYRPNVISNRELSNKVQDYINEHSDDDELCIESVLEHFKETGEIVSYDIDSDVSYITLDNI